MNGRIYDPLLGRFLSADLQVQFAGNLQGFNRYSYVNNNPLSFTDPTGWGLSPASASMGWKTGVPENHVTPAQERAIHSGTMAAPFTFLVKNGAALQQIGLLSQMGAPGASQNGDILKMSQELSKDSQAYLKDASEAIMQADGVSPQDAQYWYSANTGAEFMGATAVTAVMPLASLESTIASDIATLSADSVGGTTQVLEDVAATEIHTPPVESIGDIPAAESNLVRGTTDIGDLSHYVWKSPTGKSFDLMLNAEVSDGTMVINDAHIMPTEGSFDLTRKSLGRSGLRQLATDMADTFRVNTIEIPNSIGRGSSGAVGSFGQVRITIIDGKVVVTRM